MSFRLTLSAALAVSLGAMAPVYAADGDPPAEAKAVEAAQSKAVNPFLAPSPLPYQFPQFDKIRNEDYRPAFEQGMAEGRREIEAIANNPDPASFDNTIVAMERAEQLLTRVSRVFFAQAGTNTNPEMPKIQTELVSQQPLLAPVRAAPTVKPPSRIANLEPCSSATGTINSTVRFTLSPGMTIATPAGNVMSPVTSIVRK